MKPFAALVILVAFSVAASGTARTADLPLPPKKQQPAPKAPAQPALKKEETDFDKLGADCIIATDGCRNFLRAGDGKFDPTNNIGIACQPKPLSCTQRK